MYGYVALAWPRHLCACTNTVTVHGLLYKDKSPEGNPVCIVFAQEYCSLCGDVAVKVLC